MNTPEPVHVGIVADDMTGAADSLVQFCNSGWQSRLLLTHDDVQKGDAGLLATARSLDSRALADDVAARVTADAVSAGFGPGPDRIYVKIDSTLRGSINGQIRGALDAWSRRFPQAVAFICPAYPQMGRVIADGRMWVRGVPLHLGAAGQDPVLPVRSSVLAELIPGAQIIAIPASPEALLDRLHGIARPGARLVFEAQSGQDLDTLAEAIGAFGPDAMPVGSGGLAASLAKVWGARRAAAAQALTQPLAKAAGRVVVAVTSLNEMALRQASHLIADFGDRVDTHAFTRQELAYPQGLQNRVDVPADQRRPIVLLHPSANRTGDTDSQKSATSVAYGIAHLVKELVAAGGVAGLVLVGGDGAQAVLAALGVSAVQLHGSFTEGVPWGHLVGGIAPGLAVATKAGGFGAEGTLSRIVSAMQEDRK